MNALLEHRLGKWTYGNDANLPGGGIVYCLDDLDRAFSEGLLNEITVLYENGMSVNELGEKFKRDPDEIFIALFHQARKGRITRPFAYKVKEG